MNLGATTKSLMLFQTVKLNYTCLKLM